MPHSSGPEIRGLGREGVRKVGVKVAESRITITTTRKPWSKHCVCGISFHPPHSLGSHRGARKAQRSEVTCELSHWASTSGLWPQSP